MIILITSGGTTEKIDDVRKITNTSTGRLGSVIADEFAAHVEVDKVFYVYAQGAAVPTASCVELIKISSADDLKNTLTDLLTGQKIDAVIHAMAVSDYTPKHLTTAENLAATIAKSLSESDKQADNQAVLTNIILNSILESDGGLSSHGKVSSNFDHLILSMKKTPKIIGLIKQLQPSTVLVGFKLLDGVPEQELLRVGYELLVKNNCDFVLANDLQQIQNNNHIGMLLKSDQSFVRMNTKEEIAREIVKTVILKIRLDQRNV